MPLEILLGYTHAAVHIRPPGPRFFLLHSPHSLHPSTSTQTPRFPLLSPHRGKGQDRQTPTEERETGRHGLTRINLCGDGFIHCFPLSHICGVFCLSYVSGGIKEVRPKKRDNHAVPGAATAALAAGGSRQVKEGSAIPDGASDIIFSPLSTSIPGCPPPCG